MAKSGWCMTKGGCGDCRYAPCSHECHAGGQPHPLPGDRPTALLVGGPHDGRRTTGKSDTIRIQGAVYERLSDDEYLYVGDDE